MTMDTNIKKDHSLKSYNTFGIDVKAKYLYEFHSVEDLKQILNEPNLQNIKKLILGCGSNTLFRKDFDGLVLVNRIKLIEIVNENEDWIWVKCGSGVVWQDFVEYCVTNDYGKVENLSLIPGTVGAAPVQNIGAYGVELKDVFWTLEAFDLATFKVKAFSREECKFAYRDSVFKSELKDKFVITSVTFQLTKKHHFNLTYGQIQQTLKEMRVKFITLKSISEAVARIRRSKLPDPRDIGNAGSFFKNVEVTSEKYSQLSRIYSDIPSYKVSNDIVKVPAAWLIEQCGWKGKRFGDAGVHPRHALVLVNYGNATGCEISNLAEYIKRSVEEKFCIKIENEVKIV